MADASQANNSRPDQNNQSAASAANPGGHLNAQQIAGIQKQMVAEFQKAVHDVELRKLAIEQAVKAMDGQKQPPNTIMELARAIYQFMLEPADEIVVKVV